MRDYSKGKIYKIVCNTTGLTYYGSTCEPILSRRLAKHRSNYKDYLNNASHSHYTTSYKVLENGNCDIILMENYPCKSNDELTSRERFYIENFDCVNKIIPTRTQQEYKDLNKEWYQDYMKEYNQQYREENREKISKQRKERYYSHREMILQQHKENYKKNNIPITCSCGTIITKCKLKRHQKSKKHIEEINNNNNNNNI